MVYLSIMCASSSRCRTGSPSESRPAHYCGLADAAFRAGLAYCRAARSGHRSSALRSGYACQEPAHAPGDAVTARRILLDGLARDNDFGELIIGLAPLHPRHNTFPGEVFLRLAADALDWCGASQGDPVPLEGIRERFLPGLTFRGRENHKLRFALLAAAALRGGAEPDLLDEVASWQTDYFWQYALFAAVAYLRAAAGRGGRDD